MENKKVLLSVRNLNVKFRVRGRILTAIRGISLDIYENESIAIVGESGSGKSVFTKTFAGMLDQNGFIDQGSIFYNDEELATVKAARNTVSSQIIEQLTRSLDHSARLEAGAETYKKILNLQKEKKTRETLSDEEDERFAKELHSLVFQKTEKGNYKQTLDPKRERDKIRQAEEEIKNLESAIKAKEAEKAALIKARKGSVSQDAEYLESYKSRMAALEKTYHEEIAKPAADQAKELNRLLAKELYLSVARYNPIRRAKTLRQLRKAAAEAMRLGVDLNDRDTRLSVFGDLVLYTFYDREDENAYYGTSVNDLSKIKNAKDWTQIRGKRIATVFQDPMTSLNPIITIGKQITSIILKHQDCTEIEARARALELMYKVGIPNAENRFDDYPFQYSGGMRQRIVIAIALSCQPKILICDEPTTALDVTIQAQILKLLKDLQRDYNYTIVFITHDLGVVANIADRVAVLYAGQIVELGTVEEVFYDPRHPYTWALLSSLPQLAERETELFSITGTPPSLYNKIVGDAFAPRNPYCMKIDTLEEPPMFQITETHFAKTWLLDPRAPKIEKPAIIQDSHNKLKRAYNI
ncbi:MAG: ATP-binding cassette domain-containing protein [Oscillospiraceae bacterium]|nr:ATP-binding cassette domain-containing protein [Oscillospiraceae bacterium]